MSWLDILRQVAHIEAEALLQASIHPHAGRPVKDIMTSTIPMVNQDEELATIVEKFALSNSYRLIVIDSQGKAVGR
jgi:predicted transcriptional regulator